MRYFAILKDSLREALDSKVLYVLIGLALLVIVFVATLSFRALSAEKALAQIVDGQVLTFLEALKPVQEGSGRPRTKGQVADPGFVFDLPRTSYRLETREPIVVLRGAADSPDADYRLTVSKMFVNKEKAAQARAQPQAEIEALRRYFGRFEKHGFCRVGDIQVVAEDQERSSVAFTVDWHATAGTRRLWLHEPSLFFGLVPLSNVAVPLGFQLFLIARVVISTGAWIALMLGVVITAFFIPNMLQKGTIDLLLVKPIHRSLLLTFKYAGGLTFILLTNTVALVGIWLVLGWRSGLWANWLLLLIPLLTFFFAILYSVSTLIAVLTRSTVTAILVTIGAWFLFYLVGTTNQVFEMLAYQEELANVPAEQRTFSDNTMRRVVEAVHRVLPRTSDLDQLAQLLVFSDFMTGGKLATEDALPADRNWWESFGVSCGFIAVMLGLACWRFSCRDY
ncbi:MAG: ABC transporter permease [Gemmataceae bacterium]|nr:ABC transporter permease [Gemmataceae bacterium]